MIVRFPKLSAAMSVELSAIMQPRFQPVVSNSETPGIYTISCEVDNLGLLEILQKLKMTNITITITKEE